MNSVLKGAWSAPLQHTTTATTSTNIPSSSPSTHAAPTPPTATNATSTTTTNTTTTAAAQLRNGCQPPHVNGIPVGPPAAKKKRYAADDLPLSVGKLPPPTPLPNAQQAQPPGAAAFAAGTAKAASGIRASYPKMVPSGSLLNDTQPAPPTRPPTFQQGPVPAPHYEYRPASVVSRDSSLAGTPRGPRAAQQQVQVQQQQQQQKKTALLAEQRQRPVSADDQRHFYYTQQQQQFPVGSIEAAQAVARRVAAAQQKQQPPQQPSNHRSLSDLAAVKDTKAERRDNETTPPDGYVVVRGSVNEPAILVGRYGLALFAKIEHVAQRGGVLNMMHALRTVVPTCLDEATALLVGTFHAVDAWARDDRLRNEFLAVVNHLDDAVAKVVLAFARGHAPNPPGAKLSPECAVAQLEVTAKRLNQKLVSAGVSGGRKPGYAAFVKTVRALLSVKQPHFNQRAAAQQAQQQKQPQALGGVPYAHHIHGAQQPKQQQPAQAPPQHPIQPPQQQAPQTQAQQQLYLQVAAPQNGKAAAKKIISHGGKRAVATSASQQQKSASMAIGRLSAVAGVPPPLPGSASTAGGQPSGGRIDQLPSSVRKGPLHAEAPVQIDNSATQHQVNHRFVTNPRPVQVKQPPALADRQPTPHDAAAVESKAREHQQPPQTIVKSEPPTPAPSSASQHSTPAVAPRAVVVQHDNETMAEMISEARRWLGRDTGVSDQLLARLLWGLKLELMESSCLAMNDELTHEDLKLSFSLPERSTSASQQKAALADTAKSSNGGSSTTEVQPPERKMYEWKVEWYDFEGAVADVYPALVGRFWCKPFVEDPPYFNKLQRAAKKGDMVSTVAERQKFNHQFVQAANSPRKTWNLRWLNGLKSKAEAWRRAAGLKTKDLDWTDVARVVCAGVGVLARDHPANNANWIFKRTMVRLEKEFRRGPTNNANGGKVCQATGGALEDEDPKDLDDVEKLRRYLGGCASDDHYFNSLKRELRWSRRHREQPSLPVNHKATLPQSKPHHQHQQQVAPRQAVPLPPAKPRPASMKDGAFYTN